MIILLHGTGDDNSKYENWIRWVEVIMKNHGEAVLTVAGVGTNREIDADDDAMEDVGQNSIGPQALAFLASLGQAEGPRRRPPKIDQLLGMNAAQRNRYAYPELLEALNAAGGNQFPKAAKVPAGGEESLIRELQAQKVEDGPKIGTGIKYRAAVASICAIAYDRRTIDPNPIRILGHSRGGSTAVAIHNILTYHGLDCDTLTLDPCHGKAKLWDNKDYYRKVWAGKLTNVPNNKNVGKDWLPDCFMCRPAIEQGGCAEVLNHPKLQQIKHGHMGKLRGFSDEEKASGEQRLFGDRIQAWIDQVRDYGYDPQLHLMNFFREFMDDYAGVTPLGRDRKFIADRVVELLTGPLPVIRSRRNAVWSRD